MGFCILKNKTKTAKKKNKGNSPALPVLDLAASCCDVKCCVVLVQNPFISQCLYSTEVKGEIRSFLRVVYQEAWCRALLEDEKGRKVVLPWCCGCVTMTLTCDLVLFRILLWHVRGPERFHLRDYVPVAHENPKMITPFIWFVAGLGDRRCWWRLGLLEMCLCAHC